MTFFFLKRNHDFGPDEYEMKKKVRVIIVNNDTFPECNEKPAIRSGSSKDKCDLAEWFKGHSVLIFENLSADDLKDDFKRLSGEDLTDTSCLIVFILTHGTGKDELRGATGVFHLKELMRLFEPDSCPTMAEKPKLFFVQACRGEPKPPVGQLQPCQQSETESQPSVEQQAVFAKDFLIVNATLPDSTAWRHKTDGSYFIQTLIFCLNDSTDLERILIKVKRVLNSFEIDDSSKQNQVYRQTTVVTSTLQKEVFLKKFSK